MIEALQLPAQATYWFISGRLLFLILNLLGLACFAYIVARRLTPLIRGQRDVRFDRQLVRLERVLQFWLGQWKHPRYRTAGVIHILVFGGFILLATRAFSLLILGISENFATPDSTGGLGHIYGMVADYAATFVFACMVVAAVRRIVSRPARYEVPAKYGKSHKVDAIFLLALIAILMLSESLFEASRAAFLAQHGQKEFLAVFSLAWTWQNAVSSVSQSSLWNLHRSAYLLDVLTFYFLLCYRPFGIQFHVETSLFNVYFSKLDKGTVKPVRWGVGDEQLDQVKSFGVKKFEDFTWKHMLDFYSLSLIHI